MPKPTCALDAADISRVIEMGWEDRTPFEAIKTQVELDEAAVIALMRQQLKPGSFRLWRDRVQGRKTKHATLRPLAEPRVAARWSARSLRPGLPLRPARIPVQQAVDERPQGGRQVPSIRVVQKQPRPRDRPIPQHLYQLPVGEMHVHTFAVESIGNAKPLPSGPALPLSPGTRPDRLAGDRGMNFDLQLEGQRALVTSGTKRTRT
jgi:uncharacterized protein (TIGR03643 family)